MEDKPNKSEPNNLQQNIKDTKDAIKDGANLAKNAASGNYLGAIKDGIKLLGNKKTWKIILISILLPIITTVAIAGAVFAIFDKVGDVIQTIVDGIISFFTVNNNSWDGSIVVDDDQIDKIIAGVEELGFDMEDLYLMGDVDYSKIDKNSEEYKETMRKYIRKFYEAQATTETPFANLGTSSDKTYGAVYIYRKNENGETNLLTYMNYGNEGMINYEGKTVTSAELEIIRKYYSLDDEGKLVIPVWNKTNDTITVSLMHKDYKNEISQYTTPMNFFVYLAEIAQNPEFVSAVTELVKDSRIEITLFDYVEEEIETEIYTYIQHEKGSRIQVMPAMGYAEIPINNSYPQKKETETHITKIIPVPKITYVKTWFCEQTIEYTMADTKFKAQDPIILNKDNDETLKDDPGPAEGDEIAAGELETWKTEKTKTITKSTRSVTYNETYRSYVKDKTGEKGDQGVANVDSKRQVPDNYKIDENTTFLGLMDDYFRIPNTKHYEAVAKANLVSGASWLFGLLQNDPDLQTLEYVMRYIMYKYTDTDYGVTSLDFSIFNIEDFSSISETGSFSAFGTNLSREEFIVAVQAYNGGSSYSKLSSDAGDFYDICTSEEYNVNPCLAFAWTCIETKYGATYNNYEQSVKDFCKLVVEPVTEGTSGYSKTTNLTSLQEKTGNLKYSVETRTKVAKAIFGNDCFLRTNKTIVDAAINIVADHFINSGVTVHYANDSVERIYKKSGKNGRTVIYNNIQKSWDLPIKYPDKYGLVCATFVSMAIWKAGLIDEATINSYGYNACKGVVSMLTKSNQWQEITNWEDLQEGDIVYQTNHIYIYMDGGKCLDQAYCVKRSTGKDDRGKLSTAEKSKFLKAYRYIEN